MHRTLRHIISPAIFLLLPSLANADWPGWGGPTGDFQLPAEGLADTWPDEGPAVVWKRSLGGGYASVLADGDRLYTAYRKGDDDVLIALDATTGKTLWEHATPAPPGAKQVTDFGVGPNATPVIHGGRLCAIGFTSKLTCVDKTSGEVAWTQDLVRDLGAKLHRFGMAASPIVWNDSIIVLVAGESYGAVGFSVADGEILWKSDALDASYSTPIVAEVAGEEQLVFMTSKEVVGVRLEDGTLRWRFPHANQYANNCSGPWWGDDGLLFVSSQADAGSVTLRLGRDGDPSAVEEVARQRKFKVFHNTAIRRGKHVFAASASGILMAYDVEKGEILWRERGYPAANMLFVGGKSLLLDEQGKLTLATLTPKGLTVHASHPLLSKPAWTPPTLVGTRLYARDTKVLVALELGGD